MSFAETFEDFKIWQASRTLCNSVYDVVSKLHDCDFKSQVQRAAVSVMNIAEGFERRTKKDFAHFLDISKGSAGEVRSMLYLAEDRSYISAETAKTLRSSYEQLSSSIGALASKLRRCNP
jgi:four helix bundle protein